MKTTGYMLLGLLLCLSACTTQVEQPIEKHEGDKLAPSDYFFLQRTYPDTVFQHKAYHAAMLQAHKDYQQSKMQAGRSGSNSAWRNEGPGNIGGRFNTLAIPAGSPNIIYAGAAAGGVWKTTNGGSNWSPIFDDQPYLAIGDIEIDPNNDNTVYVGTGDPNIGGYPSIGDGVYKSTDAGATWTNIGLTDARIISHIEVHPQNSNLIYVSTMGLPFEKNNNRGLYKSTDAGATWQQVLFLSDSAGIADLVLDPTDTNTLYVTGWNRVRNNRVNIIYGPESLIYKSTDGGATWNPIMNGIAFAGSGILSRISIEMSGTDHNVLFASISDSSVYLKSIYKSVNAGASWSSVSISTLDPDVSGGFAWYFDQIKVNPADDDQLFVLGVELHRTDNGGGFWDISMPYWYEYIVHADIHDLVFEGNAWYLATDGGLYKTINQGQSWIDIENIPVSQFYHVQSSSLYPGDYFGGMQDNGTAIGNSFFMNGWQRIFGGDGFKVQIHPTNPDIFYFETQNGDIWMTDDGGYSVYDVINGISQNDRKNWDLPYKLSYTNATTLYAGTQRVYKSTGSSYPSWQAVSGDLTNGLIYYAKYHTLSVVEDSRINGNIVFAGTSDGNLWRSTNGGSNWTEITGTLPDRYITGVATSYFTAGLTVVSHSGYKDYDNVPHLHLSRDNGDTWVNISGNLPDLAINDAEISPVNDSVIFVATDGGVYYTSNQGANWQRMGNNMPVIPVYDIEIVQYNSRLLAGTFARSIMSIGIDSLLIASQPQPIIALVSADVEICPGYSTVLSVSGGNSYVWSPSTGLSCTNCANPTALPLVSTTYKVTATSSLGATDTASVKVTILPDPDLPLVSYFGDSVFVTNPQTGASYQWYKNSSAILGANSLYYIANQNGAYYVEAFINQKCKKPSTPVFLDLLGVATNTAQALQVYPNPFTDHVVVSGVSIGSIWQLYDVTGRLLQAGVCNQSTEVLEIDETIAAGIFYMQLVNEPGNPKVFKLLKQ